MSLIVNLLWSGSTLIQQYTSIYFTKLFLVAISVLIQNYFNQFPKELSEICQKKTLSYQILVALCAPV